MAGVLQVSQTLALLMGASFPPQFYSRLSQASQSAEAGGVPLGGSAGTGAASRDSETTSVQTSTAAIQVRFFFAMSVRVMCAAHLCLLRRSVPLDTRFGSCDKLVGIHVNRSLIVVIVAVVVVNCCC